MPFLALVAEMTLIYLFIQAYGFLNLFLFYIASTGLGILIVTRVGSKALKEIQTGQVTNANRSLISRGLLFVSGLLLIVPSMWTKVFGIVLLFPPTRWIASVLFTGFLLKRVFSSDSMLHQFSNRGFSFHFQSQGRPPFFDPEDSNHGPSDPNVIDAEFRKIEDDPKLLK